MTEKVLSWQPNYSVITLPNNNLIVLASNGEFLFEYNAFPLFNLIDGKKTQNEIASNAKSQEEKMRFYSICEYFLSKNQYITDTVDTEKQALAKTITCVGNRLYSNLDFDFGPLFSNIENVQLIITDNLLTASQELQHIKGLASDLPICIVSITDTTTLISPILSNVQEAETLTQTLEANKPVLKFVKAYSGTDLTIPSATQLDVSTSDLLNKLAKIIQQHLAQPERSCSLIEYNNKTNHLESHPFSPISVTRKLDSKISLNSQTITFDNDGGSRCLSAQQTVEKLKPFISPITGQITHIEKLPKTKGSSISIFKTAFFKSPPIKNANNIANDSFVQICLGKGVSESQSMASALCETIERKNAQYRYITPTVFAHQSELSHRSYNFNQLVPYSKQQYKRFSDPHNKESNRTQAAVEFDSRQINWQQVWSLSHNEPVYIPYVSCFANTPYEEDQFGKWHSNGCAAGNNLEEAIMQGLFELLERDAVAIWWYNKLLRPPFDLTKLDTGHFAPLHQAISKDYEYWVLDLTIDTGVSVMAAIGKNKLTSGWVFGFGCHLKPQMAAQRALTELCQLIPIRDQGDASFDFDAITHEEFLKPNNNSPAFSPQLEPSGDLKLDILAVIEQLQNLGMETLALDYSQEPIPIKTANVFVPGLCHIWPQLANSRLYDTPVKLGIHSTPLNESTINQQGLYI
ncbi:YcaO-like family protein [Pseudoalteromonas luteoviolacea]|uniref:YcaO domain-containing protein n=1 Tax=Pseudoalteromonas luteoviolacea DSM 6061 TaxID=1365250 RepID=A0A166YM82_9GAMM|nr:YcaO-like family protein [Pseudoalteromonas luteoviolacea]KZN43012.1 hypothetical protein N475_00095 [Pseudoalteromonas luteoviolacea DSM 6061]MBE0385518.1 hypothetical protein [Pseudoalteromonas luteoviolacea DSM 6061]